MCMRPWRSQAGGKHESALVTASTWSASIQDAKVAGLQAQKQEQRPHASVWDIATWKALKVYDPAQHTMTCCSIDCACSQLSVC